MENKPLTIKDLAQACLEELKKGNGDKVVMLSNDDEGNGYHYLWYSFTTADEYLDGAEEYGMDIDGLDETVAPLNKTIILG